MKTRIILLALLSLGMFSGCGVLPVHPAFCPGTYYYGPRPIVAPFLPAPGGYNCAPGMAQSAWQSPVAAQPAMQPLAMRPQVVRPHAARTRTVVQASYQPPRADGRSRLVYAEVDQGCQCSFCRQRRQRIRRSAHGTVHDSCVVGGDDCCSAYDACLGETWETSACSGDMTEGDIYGMPDTAYSYADHGMSYQSSGDCPCQNSNHLQMRPAGGSLHSSPPAIDYQMQDDPGVPMPRQEATPHEGIPAPVDEPDVPVTHWRTQNPLPSINAGQIQMTAHQQLESLIIPDDEVQHAAMKDATRITPAAPSSAQQLITIPATRVVSRRVE